MRLRPGRPVYRQVVPGIEPVPTQYTPVQSFRYPIDNAHAFERWYLDTFVSSNKMERVYLPVQWTAFYCNNRFGQDAVAIKRLQEYLNKLDTSKCYYTIIQFDDGILNNIDHLNLKIFSMGGGRVDHCLPLLCMPHREHKGITPDTFASFIGRETHPIRQNVLKLEGKPGYYVSSRPHNLTDYTWHMAKSVFSLAPRGYGPTSFRICEAVQAGSIPVYISDKHCLPYGIPFNYGVLLGPQDDIDDALLTLDPTALRNRLRDVRGMFTYQYAKEWILKTLRNG
jgi:Exostosin family